MGQGLELPGGQDKSGCLNRNLSKHALNSHAQQIHTSPMPSAYPRDNAKNFKLTIDTKNPMNFQQSYFLSSCCRNWVEVAQVWKTEVETELGAPPGRGSPSQLGECQKESWKARALTAEEAPRSAHRVWGGQSQKGNSSRGKGGRCPLEMAKIRGEFRISQQESTEEHTHACPKALCYPNRKTTQDLISHSNLTAPSATCT